MKSIYIISENENILKIGISDNPSKRIKQLQTGYPGKLEIKYQTELDSELCQILEKFIHRNLKKYKIQGEWFKVNLSIAIQEIEFVIIRYSNSAKIMKKYHIPNQY